MKIIYSIIFLSFVFFSGQYHALSQSISQNFFDLILSEPNDPNFGNSLFGHQVSVTGDLNGDGSQDFIVGAYQYYNYTGRVYVYFGSTTVSDKPDVVLTGEAADSYFGFSLSCAGDVNGDGNDDVIVGAYGTDGYGGRCYIYYGGQNMDANADVILSGESQFGGWFGFSVAKAGDMNNDGFSDVIVGAKDYRSRTGKAYVFFGGSPMDNRFDAFYSGSNYGDEFGHAVSSAGDVNGDGYDDVLVGSIGYNSATGRASIFGGGNPLTPTPLLIIEGENTGDKFGSVVATIGDVNNDGFDDFMVSSFEINNWKGRAYLYLGNSQLDSQADLILTGEKSGDYFGVALSAAGDLNKDGYGDFLIGAKRHGSGLGAAFIYFGASILNSNAYMIIAGESRDSEFGASISATGDINGDGYVDCAIGAPKYGGGTGRIYVYLGSNLFDAIADQFLFGETGIDNAYAKSISSAGDVNGDGFDDIIVGAFQYQNFTGQAYIYFGGAAIDTIPDVLLTGEFKNDYFGYTVAGVGDVNNDGYDDVLVGAPKNQGSSSGKAYLFLGGNIVDAFADLVIISPLGQYGSNGLGLTVSSAGDVNNDGYNDFLVGGDYYYNDQLRRVYLYLGGLFISDFPSVVFTEKKFNSSFGWNAISSAGDVNGDDFDDIIIGAYSGREVFIYFGADFIDDRADLILTSTEQYDAFGYSVASAGDVNNDDFSDVIVGDEFRKKVYVFHGGSSMDNMADITLSADELKNTRFGYAVSSISDINSDGYDDIIIGATASNNFTGEAYLYLGGKNIGNIPALIISGIKSGDEFGEAVAAGGDLNGDGLADVLIGAPYHEANGAIFIYKTLTPQIAPVPDQVIKEDSLFSCIISAAGYPPLTFSLLYAPTKMTLQSSSGLLEWTPENDDVGVDSVMIVVTNTLGSDTLVFRFTVVNMNDEPQQFRLLSPENNAVLKIPDEDSLALINFSWRQAYDPDSGDVVNYTLLLSTDSTFTIPGMIEEIAANTDTTIALKRAVGKYFWRVRANDREGVDVLSPPFSESPFQFKISRLSSVTDDKIVPAQFKLAQNYPNPFNPATVIRFTLPIKLRANLLIFNTRGQVISTLIDDELQPGNYEIFFNADDLPSGVYIYQFKSKYFNEVRKMLLIK